MFSSLQWVFSPFIFLTEIRKNIIMKQISFPTLRLWKICGKNSSFVPILGNLKPNGLPWHKNLHSLWVFSSLIFPTSRDREMTNSIPKFHWNYEKLPEIKTRNQDNILSCIWNPAWESAVNVSEQAALHFGMELFGCIFDLQQLYTFLMKLHLCLKNK